MNNCLKKIINIFCSAESFTLEFSLNKAYIREPARPNNVAGVRTGGGGGGGGAGGHLLTAEATEQGEEPDYHQLGLTTNQPVIVCSHLTPHSILVGSIGGHYGV